MNKQGKGIIHNTPEKRWEQLLLYYQWFFTAAFLCFGVVLLADRTIFLGAMFCLLAAQLLPLKAWRRIRGRLPKLFQGMLWLLNLAGIYVGFLQIVK